MGNLFSSLLSSANSLRTFDQALSVVQNNVSNASTPGYAKQVQGLAALRFLPEEGLSGGVAAADLISRRDESLEEAVRYRQSSVSFAEQRTSDLTQIEPLFSPIANAGISGALSSFFQSVSQASVSPNSTTTRQIVLDRAGDVAQSFRETAAGVQNARADADQQVKSTVTEINAVLEQIREFNIGRRANRDSATDAGVDANLHNALEHLSELTNFKAIENADQSLTILAGGSEPVLIGDHLFKIDYDITEGGAAIVNSQGDDITASVNQGRLGALLELRNETLPGYAADLDTLAAGFIDRVNLVLSQGLDANGATPSRNLFGRTNLAHPAATMYTVSDFQTGELALAFGTVTGGNGNAIRLAAVQNEQFVSGFSLTEYYGNIGANIGRDLNEASDSRETQASLLSQAQNLRQARQGVSLDEEAATLMMFQKSYEACAKIVKVLDDLTIVTLGLLR